jgi:hypothetical protein
MAGERNVVELQREGSPRSSSNAPTDPELARRWSLALAKFEAREGRPPATRADVNRLSGGLHRLDGETRAGRSGMSSASSARKRRAGTDTKRRPRPWRRGPR